MMAVPVVDSGRVTSIIALSNKPEDYTSDDSSGIASLLNKMNEMKRQKELEETLRQNEEKFRTVADFTYDWEAWSAPDGKFKWVSPSCKRVTGHSADEFITDHNLMITITHPEDQHKVISHNQIAVDNNGGGGINAEAMASAALGQALGYLPPPYNLMASIALKVLTSVSEGNACTDEDLAMSWGPQQYKTNKALKFSQCHDVDSGCVSKLFGGSCIRRAYYKCCYDQEITKIFVEGVKEQLGKSWIKNQCDDIEISDLKEVSFRKCLNNENPINNKCFPQDSWLALNIAIKKQAVKGFDANSLGNMAIDAMPIGNDPWGPRVGD